MKVEKRENRGYKATDKVYDAAMRRAKKDKYPLAQIIEEALRLYGKTGNWPIWQELKPSLDFNHG